MPFTALTGIVFSNESVRNVTVDHGTILSEGKNTVVVGMGFPGLEESLQSVKDKTDHILDDEDVSAKTKERFRDL